MSFYSTSNCIIFQCSFDASAPEFCSLGKTLFLFKLNKLFNTTLKCLLIRQPYASLIAYGQKRIEFRNYKSHFTGKIMIAAARGKPFKTTDNKLNIASKKFPRGKILSTATLEKVELFRSRDLRSRINGYNDIIIHGSQITTVANPLGEPITDVFSALNDENWIKYAWFLDDIKPLEEPVDLITKGFGPWINLSEEENAKISYT